MVARVGECRCSHSQSTAMTRARDTLSRLSLWVTNACRATAESMTIEWLMHPQSAGPYDPYAKAMTAKQLILIAACRTWIAICPTRRYAMHP